MCKSVPQIVVLVSLTTASVGDEMAGMGFCWMDTELREPYTRAFIVDIFLNGRLDEFACEGCDALHIRAWVAIPVHLARGRISLGLL